MSFFFCRIILSRVGTGLPYSGPPSGGIQLFRPRRDPAGEGADPLPAPGRRASILLPRPNPRSQRRNVD